MNLHRYLVLGVLLLLAGCGTVGSKPQPPAKESATASQVTAPKRGGYYLDDGPGDNPPADIDALPDAQPRPEPLLVRANRPYVALGENYTPMTAFQPYRARGMASWYGRRFHGNKTSSGEVYDMYGMTAAHPTLPIPSYVRVTNPDNGRSVVVRVNDRGPFHKERLIDLSYAAAYKLRLIGKGSGQVEVEAIDTRAAATDPRVKAAYAAAYNLRNGKVSPGGNVEIPVTAAAVAPPAVPGPMPANAVAGPITAKVVPQPATAGGSYIQVGAFKRKENAEQLIERLRQQSFAASAVLRNWYNNGVYRVRLGPYASLEDVERVAAQIRQVLGISNLVITQQEIP